MFLLLAVRELWKDRPERAAILAVTAALVKPQLAILVPIVAFVTIRRALWPAGGYGDEPAPERTGFGWERRTRGAIRILSTAVAGFVTAVVLSAPFGLSVISFSTDRAVPRSRRSCGSCSAPRRRTPYVTVNAYNLWALFPAQRREHGDQRAVGPRRPDGRRRRRGRRSARSRRSCRRLLLGLLLFVVVPRSSPAGRTG